jgi:hypothetical protein
MNEKGKQGYGRMRKKELRVYEEGVESMRKELRV